MLEQSLAKFQIQLTHAFKVIGKGKVAEGYKKAWQVADELAHAEMQEYELSTSFSPIDIASPKRELEYKSERRDYHLGQIVRLLELYISEQSSKGHRDEDIGANGKPHRPRPQNMQR